MSSVTPVPETTTYGYDLDNRRLSATQPNGLVTTNQYDWKTGGIEQVTQEIDAGTPTTDIVTLYQFDANGRPTTVTDGRGNDWVKAWDAMGRLVSLETPDPGGGTFTQSLVLDGNGNILQTTDFNGNDYFYAYDALNRMTGLGTSSGAAATPTYTWNCCNSLSGYGGGSSLTYDDLGRLESHTDPAGLQVQYEYDSMGRVKKLVPPQGTNYRTEYTYNKNGSLSQAQIYDAGTPEDTDYVYDATSGELARRDFPTVANAFIRTSYGYDGAGRLDEETVQHIVKAGPTTNQYKTLYAYNTLTYGTEVVRTEQNWATFSWLNSAQLTYRKTALGWQEYEEREEWTGAAWASKYDITQTYDKCGNRATFHKNTAAAGTYGRDVDLTYNYDVLNRPTTMTDADQNVIGGIGVYTATFVCDDNGNITQVTENVTTTGTSGDIFSYYTYDDLNRLILHRTENYDAGLAAWVWTERIPSYSAIGAMQQSYYGSGVVGGLTFYTPPVVSSWDQSGRHIQDQDTGLVPAFGAVWHWAGAANAPASPLKAPNPDASQSAYSLDAKGGAGTPVRYSYVDPGTAGNERNLWGQGMPNAVNSVSSWATGVVSTAGFSPGVDEPVESRFEFNGTVAAGNASRQLDVREKGRIGLSGNGLSYAGSSPRVTSEAIGRDLNPLGRGDGMAYVGGALNLGRIAPSLPCPNCAHCRGWGASVNNSCSGENPDCVGRAGPGTCWCDCCEGPACADGYSDMPGTPTICCPKKCSTKGATCLGHGSYPCNPPMYCDLSSAIGGKYPDFCATEHPPTAQKTGFTSWMPNIRFTDCFGKTNDLREALKKACDSILNCCFVPVWSGNCFREFCEGRKTLNITCGWPYSFNDNPASQKCRKEFNLRAFTAPGDIGRSCTASSGTIFLCTPRLTNAAATIAHELLHLCDCKTALSRSQNKRCRAEIGHEVLSFKEGLTEGFVNSCMRCCFNNYSSSYSLPYTKSSPCCSCLECGW